VFAYSLSGLFLGYLYFSIPRVIVTVMAAATKLDASLEEAARSLGASPWRIFIDVVMPALMPALIAGRCSVLCYRDGRIRHRIYARHRPRRIADEPSIPSSR